MKRELEPGKTPDELNARRFEALEGQVVAAPFFWYEDEVEGLDLSGSIRDIVSGKVGYFKFAAGEASRLWKSFVRAGIIHTKDANNPEVQAKYRMWNINLWEVADLVRKNLGALEKDRASVEAEKAGIDKEIEWRRGRMNMLAEEQRRLTTWIKDLKEDETRNGAKLSELMAY
jgi:hypothetical protein